MKERNVYFRSSGFNFSVEMKSERVFVKYSSNHIKDLFSFVKRNRIEEMTVVVHIYHADDVLYKRPLLLFPAARVHPSENFSVSRRPDGFVNKIFVHCTRRKKKHNVGAPIFYFT